MFNQNDPFVLRYHKRGECITENLNGRAHKEKNNRFDERHIQRRIGDEKQYEKEQMR